MGDGNRMLLMQAQQHARIAVAEVVDQAVMQPAEASAGIQRDIGDAEGANDIRHRVAAISRATGSARLRALH